MALPSSGGMTKISWSKTGMNDIPYMAVKIGKLPEGISTTKDFLNQTMPEHIITGDLLI